MKIHSILSTCILLTSFMSTVEAGLMIKERGEDKIMTQIYQDGLMISLSGNKVLIIADSRRFQCTWFNHFSRKFARGKCPELDKFTENVLEAQVPAEQLAMMQEMMNQETEGQSPSIQVKKIGRTAFQSFAVDKYHFLIKEHPVAEVWLSSDLSRAIAEEVSIETMKLLFGDQGNENHPFAFKDAEVILEEKIDALSEKEEAYVIKSMKIMMPDDLSSVEMFGSQVIEIKTGNFDLTQYRVPSDYEEVGSINELMQ